MTSPDVLSPNPNKDAFPAQTPLPPALPPPAPGALSAHTYVLGTAVLISYCVPLTIPSDLQLLDPNKKRIQLSARRQTESQAPWPETTKQEQPCAKTLDTCIYNLLRVAPGSQMAAFTTRSHTPSCTLSMLRQLEARSSP